jgi:hypothetical protein
MEPERNPASVGRKTRRADDSDIYLQQIRAGFEPGFCARSNPAIDANTRTARLKPRAVGPVTMHRSGRAEVFALPGPSGHPSHDH